jgi:hypothetical protein
MIQEAVETQNVVGVGEVVMVLCQGEVSKLVTMDKNERYVITAALFAFSL